jgi:hypothetical protein
MRNISDKICGENQTPYCFITLIYLNSYRLWDNAEKSGTATRATDSAHAHFMLNN